MSDLPPNHHAELSHSGPSGYVSGLTMIVGRGNDARLVAELADVQPGDHVLDIGCGPGTAARNAARDGITVTGVDPSGPMLREARLLTRLRRPTGGVEWVEAGVESLPLPGDSVRVCWSLASVHHWPDLEAGLTEVRRVMTAGGVFLALERRSPVGATGTASHGWTAGQADAFAVMLLDHGFVSADVSNHDMGRRKVVVVTGRT